MNADMLTLSIQKCQSALAASTEHIGAADAQAVIEAAYPDPGKRPNPDPTAKFPLQYRAADVAAAIDQVATSAAQLQATAGGRKTAAVPAQTKPKAVAPPANETASDPRDKEGSGEFDELGSTTLDKLGLPPKTVKMLAGAKFTTAQDVITFINKGGKLESINGVGKVIADTVVEAIRKLFNVPGHEPQAPAPDMKPEPESQTAAA